MLKTIKQLCIEFVLQAHGHGDGDADEYYIRYVAKVYIHKFEVEV